ncbi:MAG: respiratory nitrate reductase subunit gamma [Desulfobacterales bacterium]|nr:respiratory nitrate reductase subunit gamma [Deltaproteobacteria bacterium]
MQTLYYIILVPMVYLAFAIFIAGTTVRLINIFRAPKHPTTLQIYPEKKPAWLWALHDTFLFPTVRKHKPLLWIFLMAFHICIVLLILGHLELFGEIGILQVIPHDIFLGQGFVGLIAAIALLYFLFRRFSSPVRELSVPEDYYLLILLFLVVLFGSQLDWARRWYFYETVTVEQYREYLASLLVFNPYLPAELTESGHSFMLVLHVFFANLFLMFFPFSQSMHSFLSLAVNKLKLGV